MSDHNSRWAKREAERARVRDKELREVRAKWLAQEEARIRLQRSVFAALPDLPEVSTLKQAMLDQAWALLDRHECEACDALLEFLPEADADKLLSEYFLDDHNGNGQVPDAPSAANQQAATEQPRTQKREATTHP